MVVDDDTMDEFMSGPFLQWVRFSQMFKGLFGAFFAFFNEVGSRNLERHFCKRRGQLYIIFI